MLVDEEWQDVLIALLYVVNNCVRGLLWFNNWHEGIVSSWDTQSEHYAYENWNNEAMKNALKRIKALGAFKELVVSSEWFPRQYLFPVLSLIACIEIIVTNILMWNTQQRYSSILIKSESEIPSLMSSSARVAYNESWFLTFFITFTVIPSDVTFCYVMLC